MKWCFVTRGNHHTAQFGVGANPCGQATRDAASRGILCDMDARIPLPDHLGGRPFTSAEAMTAGLGRNRLRGPDLQRPFRGVHVATRESLGLLELCRALQRKLPHHAYFSGVTAARIMGVPLPTRHERSLILHVAVPAPHRAISGRGVRGHAFHISAEDVRDWRGLSHRSARTHLV